MFRLVSSWPLRLTSKTCSATSKTGEIRFCQIGMAIFMVLLQSMSHAGKGKKAREISQDAYKQEFAVIFRCEGLSWRRCIVHLCNHHNIAICDVGAISPGDEYTVNWKNLSFRPEGGHRVFLRHPAATDVPRSNVGAGARRFPLGGLSLGWASTRASFAVGRSRSASGERSGTRPPTCGRLSDRTKHAMMTNGLNITAENRKWCKRSNRATGRASAPPATFALPWTYLGGG